MNARCVPLFVPILTSTLLAHSVGQAPASHADGWNGLWGAARNGEAATSRAPARLREIWRRPTAGGYSEVVADGDTVYTTELRGDSDFTVALDGATGRERWSTRLGPTYQGHGGSHDGPIATPAVGDGDVFVAGPHGVLAAMDRATGRERWRHDLVRTFGATPPAWGFGASPLVIDRLVIVPTGGEGSRGLLALDRTTGRLAWSASHAKSPAAFSAVERWRSPRLRAFNGPSIYRDGRVFGFAGPQLICMDAATGEVRWRERTGEGTLVGPGGHLLLLGQTSGDLHVLRASPDRFSEVLRARVLTPDTPSVTGPSVAGRRLYVRNIREIAAFAIE